MTRLKPLTTRWCLPDQKCDTNSIFLLYGLSLGSYDSRSKNRFTLSCEMPMICDSLVQVVDLGSLIKNYMYLGKHFCLSAGGVGIFINLQIPPNSPLFPRQCVSCIGLCAKSLK